MNAINLPDQVTKMLKQHHFGVLATYGGEYPYTSLISIAFTDNVSCLVFPTLRETQKYANLLYENRVSVMLENRAFESDPKKFHAFTLLCTTEEVIAAEARTELEKLLLRNHLNLSDFLRQPTTALIQVTIKKAILVEEFQKVQEFNYA